jgi:hypothetical protein
MTPRFRPFPASFFLQPSKFTPTPGTRCRARHCRGHRCMDCCCPADQQRAVTQVLPSHSFHVRVALVCHMSQFSPRYTHSSTSPRRPLHEMHERVTVLSIINDHMLRHHTTAAIGAQRLFARKMIARSHADVRQICTVPAVTCWPEHSCGWWSSRRVMFYPSSCTRDSVFLLIL